MEKVIITGADGFVGSYTVQYFLAQGKTVLALDLGYEPKRLKPNPNLQYFQCDISNKKALQEIVQPGQYDTFIHFAWSGLTGDGRSDYKLQLQNATNTVECLIAAKELGCSRFVCAGSIMEYEVEAAVHTQGSRPGMAYIYGMGKHVAHCMCKSIADTIGIDLLWPMITNAYGIGELSPRFISTTLRKIIDKEPLKFTAAEQNYDFVYVSDVARAFYLVAERGIPFCEYLIGSGNARPLKEFILEMLSVCGAEMPPLFGDIPYTGTNIPIDILDIEAIRRDCGFEIHIPFNEGVRMTMDWLNTIRRST